MPLHQNVLGQRRHGQSSVIDPTKPTILRRNGATTLLAQWLATADREPTKPTEVHVGSRIDKICRFCRPQLASSLPTTDSRSCM
jgi:hypothetical protein